MSGLNERQRPAFSQLVATARSTLYEDAERTLRGTYGILPDGTLQPVQGLASDRSVRARRATLEAVIHHLRADGASARPAVERLTREVAFTHLNRLLAIRVADALGILAPSLRDGAASAGFRQWVTDLAPLLATADDTGGYWTYLSQCADELAVDAPALFDPRNPLLALRPSKAALERVVALLADPANADLWDADDTFGWAYQFFNTKDERQRMRDKSAAPRDSRELAVRNQFFTPAYVVRFLVHNTLGRRLVDADPATPLLDQLDLLVDPPTIKGAPVALAQIKVLDPACGSGHFLLGCYDVLEAAWALQGVPPEAAAARIVPCLWGIDIDPRAVQVAQAAVIFRARRACGRAPLPPPNIVCARALPEDEAAWTHAEAGLGADLRRLVSEMRAALRDAPVLGSLLKVERRLDREIRSTIAGADDTGYDLFTSAGIAHDNFGNAERAVLAALQRAADATTSTPAERLLAAEASDAVRFLEAVRHRYDAVLMNPPFGEPVPETKEYLKAAYPWIPTKDYNLLAAFVGRGLELCRPDGYVGAITSRAGLFLKTFEAWRTEVLLRNTVVALADFGLGVMEDALVESAAYVVSSARSQHDHVGVYIRLLRDADRPAGLAAAVANSRKGEDRRVFRVPNEDFAAIPGGPMAYWMSESIRRLFTDLPRLEGNGGEVRQGLASGDDFRFLRVFWEVDPRRIAQTRDETNRGKRWVPFAKGGEYSPYWSDIHLLLDWEHDGERIRGYPGARPQNIQYFFRPGLTWPRRTASGFGIRALPSGCAFGDKGPAIVTEVRLPLMAWLTSRIVVALIGAQQPAGDETQSGVASKSYEVGEVQNLPWPFAASDSLDELAQRVRTLVECSVEPDRHDETCRLFSGAWHRGGMTIRELAECRQRGHENRALAMLAESQRVEQVLLHQLEIDENGRQFLDDDQSPHADSYPREPMPDVELAARFLAEPIDRVIDEIVSTTGGSRAVANLTYVGDRRLEVLAHAFRRHPSLLVELRRERGILPPEEPARTAADLVSYLVGVAFGRWDPRETRSMGQFDPFAPVPLCPPTMLVGDDGFPTTVVPSGYPLPIPSDGVLLDEPGHTFDLTSAVESAARVAIPNQEALLDDAVAVLGGASLREYLAKAFFKEHLGRYSKSRRQAPVYWQLALPSGQWSAWLYAPRFSREMLYALVALAGHRLALADERLRAFQGDDTLSGRQRQKAVDEERTLAAELQELRDDVARLAGLGWQPDLDDGHVLCAAPFARWFPKNTWRQLDEQLTAIKTGAYPWSGIHQYRDAL